MRSLYVALVLLITASSLAFCVTEGRNGRGAATTALSSLQQIVTKDNYRQMGFASPDEIENLTVGEPFSTFYVRLDQLREFSATTNPDILLVDTQRLLYPVLSKGQVRSSVTMAVQNDSWRAAGFGEAKLIQKMTAARKDSNDFVVQVPSLSLIFLGRRPEGVLVLQPLSDNARLGLQAGEALPAADVFLRLVPEARRYNELPR